MRGTKTLLDSIKDTIAEAIKAEDYRLYRPPGEGMHGIDKPKLVNPAVTTGCLPHSNFSLYGAGNEYFQAPYVLVGMEDGQTDNDEQITSILINVCCYSQGLYIENQSESNYNLMIPDNKGFDDCILFLEWIQDKIMEAGQFLGHTVELPIRMGSYNSKELTYPYAFGYISFDIKGSGYQIDRKKLMY